MEKNTLIRKATMADIPRVMEVYATARQFMKESGNPTQWTAGYPQAALVEQDVTEGRLYVMTEEARIFGCFMLCAGPDPTYMQIFDGRWGYDTSYGVIHRVASDGSKRGVVASCVAFARQYYCHLRIDTHRDNRVMQHLVEKAGFRYCGIIYVDDGTERLAYDRKR